MLYGQFPTLEHFTYWKDILDIRVWKTMFFTILNELRYTDSYRVDENPLRILERELNPSLRADDVFG